MRNSAGRGHASHWGRGGGRDYHLHMLVNEAGDLPFANPLEGDDAGVRPEEEKLHLVLKLLVPLPDL